MAWLQENRKGKLKETGRTMIMLYVAKWQEYVAGICGSVCEYEKKTEKKKAYTTILVYLVTQINKNEKIIGTI